MINLLPTSTKKDFKAARMNVVLLRYNFFALGAAGVLVILCLLFYVVLHNNQASAVSTTNDNSAKAAQYANIRKSADEYRNNLTIAGKILDNGVNYTNVVFAITKLLPDGVILDGLTLNATDFGQQISFSAHAKNYDTALKLKQNFQEQDSKDPSKSLFSNVYFQTLTDSSDSGMTTSSAYPISVNISAKLSKEVQ